MDKKKLILLAVALVIAIGTAVGARTLFAGAAAEKAVAAQPVTEELPMVVVAQNALPVGTIITEKDLSLQPWPKDLMKDAYFIQTPKKPISLSEMSGRVVRFAVSAGEPVTQGALVAPGDRGFLAAALGPGMRAVTIPVTPQTGGGGFIFPGDRVDVILTQKVSNNNSDGPELKASETIVRNLRVLATNQTTVPTKDDKGQTVADPAIAMITIEATPRIAEKITVAQSIGTISLSLRSLADSEADIDRALAKGDIKLPEGMTPAEERAYLARVQGLPQDGKPTFVTGGDVSRFQPTKLAPPKQDRNVNNNPAPAPSYNPPAPKVAAPKEPAKPSGPVVRVSRGGEVKDVQF